jgi:adenosylcobinamide kinase/adenosylcobinamide-phosphate guanylyltransferase
LNQIILITGPARSGKSEWAEYLALKSRRYVTYVATAATNPEDSEWTDRINQHCRRRPISWQTIEAAANLDPILTQASSQDCLLIDSLGTWLAHYVAIDEPDWQQIQSQLLTNLQQTPALVILVAEETGWGLVPPYPTGRLFRDRLGTLSRQIGAVAHQIYLVTGGHVLDLKQLGTPLPNSPSFASTPMNLSEN